MKFKARIFKEVAEELLQIDEGNEIDNDQLHDMIYDCWEYHNAEALPKVIELEEREMVKEFLLFHYKDFEEGKHTIWLKPEYKAMAMEVH